MGLNILLIASEMDNQEKYLSLLKGIGVNITSVTSFNNLEKAISETIFHGMMVDFNTKFKAVKENRAFVYSIMEKFPVVLLRLDKDNKKIKAFYSGNVHGVSLEDFIEQKCRPFKGRRFRYHVRKPVNFNVTISKNISMEDAGCEQSTTLNVSRGGCFIFSTQKWERGDDVWIAVRELEDQFPARGVVRFAVPWGTELCVPGIGVELTEIRKEQKEQLQTASGL